MWTMLSHPRVMAVGLLALWLPPSPAAAQLFGGFSDEQEIELGREAAAMMEEDLQLLQDEEVSAYVTRLGNELASRSGRADLAYTFRVVDTAEINAFALPGGFIYVHRGLIEAAENESELAGVLGHEIGHVVARHGVDQMRRAQIANLGLGVLGSLLGGGRAAEVGGMAADLVASGTFMKFSRDAEREADQLGVRNLADMATGLGEMLRVLRPGGRLVVLEFSRPTAPVLAGLYRFYLKRVLPRIGDGVSRRTGPYGYLARTIADFPDAPTLAGRIREAGFAACEWSTMTGGIVAAHVAIKG